jgi:hypothetical protein
MWFDRIEPVTGRGQRYGLADAHRRLWRCLMGLLAVGF